MTVQNMQKYVVVNFREHASSCEIVQKQNNFGIVYN